VTACNPGALAIVGRDVTVDEVLAVVLRDREYYAESGGMTLSGGEPLFQPDFAAALLAAAKDQGLHCCVETSGFANWAALERILPLVDLFLYDYKESSPQLHQAFTGQPNQLILANLRRLHDAGAAILLRCPMIPEHNARREHLDGIAGLARDLPKLRGVEILPYHRLGQSKQERFGLRSRMPDSVQAPDAITESRWQTYLIERGVKIRSAGQSGVEY